MKTSSVVSSVLSFLTLILPHLVYAQIAPSYRIVPLGNFAPSGGSYSYRMSDSGDLMTGISRLNSQSPYTPFIYTRSGGYSNPGSPAGAPYSWGQSINDSGRTLVIVASRSYIYTRVNSSYQEIMNPFGGTSVGVLDINNNNLVVGSARDSLNQLRAFLWNNGVVTDLTALYGITNAININNDGDIACSITTTYTQGCVIIDGILHMINTSGSQGGIPLGMNNLGTVVGSSGDITGLARGFKYDGVSQLLPIINNFNPAHPKDISDCGQIVGTGFTMPPNALFSRAFIMSNLVIVDLNTRIPANSGWILQDAVDIAKTNGRILINGTLNGEFRSAILIPIGGGTCQ